MNKLKKYFLATLLLVFVNSDIPGLQADECCHTNGCGYEGCRVAPSISPQVAAAVVAITATVAVLLYTSDPINHHAH